MIALTKCCVSQIDPSLVGQINQSSGILRERIDRCQNGINKEMHIIGTQ